MKIGIDCRTILNPGFGENAGVGHYTYCLVQALLRADHVNRYVLFFDRNVAPEAVQEFTQGHPLVEEKFLPSHQYRKYLPGIYSQIFLPASFVSARLDLLFSPSGHLPMTYIGPAIVTTHDLAVFRNPAWFPVQSKARSATNQELFVRSIRKARRIIAVSTSTKRDLMELLSVPEHKISVIPEGVTEHRFLELGGGEALDLQEELGDEAIRARYELPPRYILSLATIEPRKNFISLIRAFKKYCLQYPGKCRDLSLAIAGAKGWKFEETFEEIAEANAELEPVLGRRPVRYLGYVTTAEKWALMRHATLFVLPTLYEGFGLSVLEAMSVGTPVVTSNRSSLPEVVGNAGILINPEFTDDMYHALNRMLGDEASRQHFGEAGKARAAQFTWDLAAKRTLEAFHRALMG